MTYRVLHYESCEPTAILFTTIDDQEIELHLNHNLSDDSREVIAYGLETLGSKSFLLGTYSNSLVCGFYDFDNKVITGKLSFNGDDYCLRIQDRVHTYRVTDPRYAVWNRLEKAELHFALNHLKTLLKIETHVQ